ncbi:probable aspartic protease At2g35615 [Prunus dulcis]|nr:probable aspartic protease At2g35615 [Prunus dulcis]
MAAIILQCILSLGFFLACVCVNAAGKPNGLTMELIHVDSPASPLYPGNISYEEEIQRLIDRSIARAQHLHYTLASLGNNNVSQTIINPLDIRPKLEFYPYGSYLVQVGIGTFDATFPARSFNTYYLYTDTGSILTWVLCEDCLKPGNQCFQTKEPPFPNSKSKSYVALCCNQNPFCKTGQCTGPYCSQHDEYMDGTVVNSILSAENFNFLSSSGQPLMIPGVVFGCAYDIRKISFGRREEFKVAGLLGLGYASISFPLQQSYQTGKVFSMCLTRQREIQTYLRFGKDVPTPPGGLRVTKLVFFKDIPYYYVNLLAISVHGQKLLIDPNVFAVRNQGTSGGCFMDNGTSFTFLIRPAFNAVVQFLEMYFMRFPRLIRGGRPLGPPFELCYKWMTPLPPLPTLTFHFENADLVINPEDLFIKVNAEQQGNYLLCLAFIPDDARTILGSVHQSNYLFIYDLNQKLLKFAPEDCSKNS